MTVDAHCCRCGALELHTYAILRDNMSKAWVVHFFRAASPTIAPLSTSIWTNVGTWIPEPKCICKPSRCCAHFLENGRHLDRVQKAPSNGSTFAALPEMLVRAWTRAALKEIGLFSRELDYSTAVSG